MSAVPPHPTQKHGAILVLAGALCVIPALWLQTDLAPRVVFAALGGLFLWLGARLLRDGPTIQRVNIALDRLNRGLFAEAEASLDAIPAGRRTNQLRRAIEIQRSMLAFRRKDVDGAVAHATRAIDGRPSILSLTHERLQIIAAHSLRAIAAAGKDDSAMARADIEAVRASPLATATTLARASLAEAIALSRSNDPAQLATLLARDRKLLLEFTTPRDRALVRALQRTLYVHPGSAYREPAHAEPEDSELGSWISHLAPAAAGLASSGAVAPRAVPQRAEVPVA